MYPRKYQRITLPLIKSTGKIEKMVQNVIKEVQDIETEADRILADAEKKAEDLKKSVAPELETLREKQEEELSANFSQFESTLQKNTDRQLKEVDGEAKEKMGKLQAIDADAFDKAVNLVVERIINM